MGDFVWVFTSASGRDKPSRRHSSTSPTRMHYPFFRERIQWPLLQELWKMVQRKLLSRQSYTQNLQVCLLLRVRTWTFLYSAIFSTYFLSAPSNIPFKSDSETASHLLYFYLLSCSIALRCYLDAHPFRLFPPKACFWAKPLSLAVLSEPWKISAFEITSSGGAC